MSDCEHPDIRAERLAEPPPVRTAIACFKCGRLFGHLYEGGHFAAYNPPSER